MYHREKACSFSSTVEKDLVYPKGEAEMPELVVVTGRYRVDEIEVTNERALLATLSPAEHTLHIRFAWFPLFVNPSSLDHASKKTR